MAEGAGREERRGVQRHNVTYPLLLRQNPEVWAELRLPPDLTPAEAERVCQYVWTLAEPDAQP